MIKVVIAEDEALTRIGIRCCVDWEKHGYEVVGEAENGEQALKMCLSLKPHILMTDIKMPVMDGMELIRQIKARGLDVKIVILTCYEEFHYLHEAMHLGVDDYLLKMAIMPERFLEVLDKVRRKYWDGDDPGAVSGESRLEALESIIMGYVDEEDEIERLIQSHRLDLHFERYALLLVEVNQGEASRSYHKNSMLNRGIRAALADCVALEARGEVAQCDWGRFVVLADPRGAEGDEAALTALIRLAQRMVQVVRQSLNVDLTVGVSRVHSGLAEMGRAQEEADRALDEGFFGRQGSVYLTGGEVKPEERASSEKLRPALRRIHDAVYLGDEAAARAGIAQLSGYMRESELRESEARVWFVRAYMTAISAYEDLGGAELDTQQKLQSLKKLILRAGSLAEITREVERLVLEIASQCGSNDAWQTHALIGQIVQYADQAFADNLTLDFISRKFGINAAYFCKLFKRIMGVTFVEYLTERRICEAKRLMRSTDLLNYEIAERTGFQNPEYFSKTFKKLTGMTPKEYKLRDQD